MNKKQILSVGIFAVVSLLAAILWWAIKPSWAPLYPVALSDSAQQNVILLMHKENIEYKIDSSKNLILVKSDQLNNAQATLAENGLPEKQNTGLEVFNSSDYGLSEFAQNINYQRGIEEELARTIKRLHAIKDARVHLTIKKDSIFEDRKQPPKASVVVQPKENDLISAENVKGIQQIVSAAIPNLEPNNVIVIKDDGVVISVGSSQEDLGHNSNALEHKYKNQIDSLLFDVFGESIYGVTVNVLADNKKKITVEENYFPDMNTGKGFATKIRVSEKTDTNPSDEKVSNKSNEEEYIYSKERSEIVYPMGEVLKISVGVVIQKDLSEVEQKRIANLIFNTLGMMESRGDRVSVFSAIAKKSASSSVPVDTVNGDSVMPAERKNDQEYYFSILEPKNKIILGVFIFLTSIAMIVFFNYLRSSRRPTVSDAELNKIISDLKSWVKE